MIKAFVTACLLIISVVLMITGVFMVIYGCVGLIKLILKDEE